MNKNLLSFLPDFQLASDVDNLITFIRQPLDRNNFFKAFPDIILKAKLDKLEFDNQTNKENFFIRLKTNWNTEKFNVPNKLLSTIGFSQNKLIEKLEHEKFLEPELTLKEALNKHIVANNKNNVNLTITNSINLLQEKNLQLDENKEKEIEIRLFFIFLKISIQRCILDDNFVSSDLLLCAAANLTTLFISNLNDMVTALKDNLTLTLIFSYDVLFRKLAGLTPNPKQETIRQLIDSLIKNATENQLSLRYDFFKKAYFSEEGFSTIFCDYHDYPLIQTCQKKLEQLMESYQNFVQLIEALIMHTSKMEEITGLAITLKKATDIYFQSILYNSVFNTENLNSIAFTTFKKVIESEMLNFQKKYLCSTEIKGILNKILNALAKLVPSFLISKEKRINLFHEKKSETKLLLKIEKSVPLMKI